MLSKYNLFYNFYKYLDPTVNSCLHSPLLTYHKNGGDIPKNNLKYRIKMKYEFFKGLYDTTVFNKAQRLYWTLSRFIYKLSLKCKVKNSMDTDLYGSPLQPRFTIELLQDNCIYKFSIHDLIKIIKTSLSHVVFKYYPSPKMPRNPFINKVFDYTHLYSIFVFAMLNTPIAITKPILILFLYADFDLKVFTEKNHKFLLDLFISTMVDKDVPVTVDLIADILLMIKTCQNPFAPINIHQSIDKNTLFKIFRPYLRLFYKHRFLHCSISHNELKRGLRNFSLFNPLFGQKYFDLKTKKFDIDVRCLNFGDFSEDGTYENIANVRGCNKTLCLPPISDVYYLPKTFYNLNKPELSRIPNDVFVEPVVGESATHLNADESDSDNSDADADADDN